MLSRVQIPEIRNHVNSSLISYGKQIISRRQLINLIDAYKTKIMHVTSLLRNVVTVLYVTNKTTVT